MNTKQIWQALTSNPVTEPYFDGVFSVDTLKEIKTKPALIICNIDPSNKPGKHWLLFFFHNNTVSYYDSLGNKLEYYGKDFIEFVKRFLGLNPRIPHYVVFIVCILLIKFVKGIICMT